MTLIPMFCLPFWLVTLSFSYMWSLNNFPSMSSTAFKIILAVSILVLTTVTMIVIVALSKFSDVYPWPVLIQLNESYQCGGSLIHKKHVLTSALCVENIDDTSKSKLKAIVGDTSTNWEVEDIFSHPDYSSATLEHNIAIIRLKQEVALSKYIRSLLPEPELIELDEEQKLVVVETRRTMMTSYIIKKKTCQKHFAGTDSSETFCAFLPAQYSNCRISMSGAPVTVNKKYGIWIFSVTSNKNYVVGIYSKQSPCGNGAEHPNLYTYVPSYLDFIEKQIAKTN